MILERRSHKFIGKDEDLVALEKKYDDLEAKMSNVPPKRRYWAGYGALTYGAFVWEREWESLAAMEAYYTLTMNDPEWSAAGQGSSKLFGDVQSELYFSF